MKLGLSGDRAFEVGDLFQRHNGSKSRGQGPEICQVVDKISASRSSDESTQYDDTIKLKTKEGFDTDIMQFEASPSRISSYILLGWH